MHLIATEVPFPHGQSIDAQYNLLAPQDHLLQGHFVLLHHQTIFAQAPDYHQFRLILHLQNSKLLTLPERAIALLFSLHQSYVQLPKIF